MYPQLNTVEGISNIYEYDITEVDSAPECNGKSVLEMITAHSHDRPDEYFKFTEICPVLDLIRAKWKLYRTWYLGWGLVHLTMMVLNTYALMPLRTESQQTSVSILSLLQSTANPANTSTTEGHDTSHSYAAFPANLIVTDIFLAVYLVYVAYILGQEIYQFVRHSPRRSSFINPVADVYYRFVLIAYGLTTLVSYPFYYTNHPGSHIPQSLGLVFGWAFLIIFTRGMKPFSFFTVIMQAAFVDIMRFSVVYILILIPFSAAFTILFQFSDTHPEFSSFWYSLFALFQLTLGLLEVDISSGASFLALSYTLYITFLTLAYVLLLNMVIALLSDTCSPISSNRQSQWHLQKLGIILFIETRLHPIHRWGSTIPKKVRVAQIDYLEQSKVPTGIKIRHLPKEHQDTGTIKTNRKYFQVS